MADQQTSKKLVIVDGELKPSDIDAPRLVLVRKLNSRGEPVGDFAYVAYWATNDDPAEQDRNAQLLADAVNAYSSNEPATALWPAPTADQKKDGWTISFEFLKDVEARLGHEDFGDFILEDIEAVLATAEKCRAALTKEDAPPPPPEPPAKRVIHEGAPGFRPRKCEGQP